MILRYLLSIGIFLVVSACATAPVKPAQVRGDNYNYTQQYLQWMINEQMVEKGIVGLSIALVDDQSVVWAQGFGYADEDAGVRALPETRYRAGSITKLFTATAIMQLVEQGKVDIDLPLQTYLPEFSIEDHREVKTDITIRQLLTHHSGLPSNLVNGMWGGEADGNLDLINELKHSHLASVPGSIRSYSNIGYALLGKVIERVSGQDYAAYIKRTILQPVHMRQSFVGDLLPDSAASRGYYDQQEYPLPRLREVAAGGLNSSVLDLARFARLTFRCRDGIDETVLSEASLRQMQTFQDGNSAFDISPAFGLGWVVSDRMGDEAGHLLSHDGGTAMFSSQLLTLPRHRLAVVVMANSNTAAGALGKIASKAIQLALESKTGIKAQEFPVAKENRQLGANDLAMLPGFWSTPIGTIEVRAGDDQLFLELEGNELEIVRRDDNLLHLRYKFLNLFETDFEELDKIGAEFCNIEGRDFLVAHFAGKPRFVVAEKITPQPLTDAWRDRLGPYRVTNSKGSIDLESMQLIYERGFLEMEIVLKQTPGRSERLRIALDTLNDDFARVHGIGRNKGDSVRVVNIGNREWIRFSGFLLKPIH